MATLKSFFLGPKGPYGTRSGVGGIGGMLIPGGAGLAGGGAGVTGGAGAGGYGGQGAMQSILGGGGGFMQSLFGRLFGAKGPEWAAFNKRKKEHEYNTEIARIIAGTGDRGYGLSKFDKRLKAYDHLDKMTDAEARDARRQNLSDSLFIDTPLA